MDIIYNPEYDKIERLYKLPVFFKSKLDDEINKTFMEQGYVDNGRYKVQLKQNYVQN